MDTAWCVMNRNDSLLLATLGRTRVESIKRMVGPEPDWRNRWRYWKRQHGCRCARVAITPLSWRVRP
jgi:hypothetical protein